MQSIRRLLSVGILLALFGAAQAQDIKPRTFTFGYGLNEQSNQGRAAKVFADKIEADSKGRLKVRLSGAAAAAAASTVRRTMVMLVSSGEWLVKRDCLTASTRPVR